MDLTLRNSLVFGFSDMPFRKAEKGLFWFSPPIYRGKTGKPNGSL